MPFFLISKGADLSLADRSGITCLMWAVLGELTELVKEVLKRNVDVNAVDIEEHHTALDFAIRDDLGEIQRLLRQAGGKTGEELKLSLKGHPKPGQSR
jgi:ankyrin repeat protein